jgi:sec-independent protein translocase protein TatC
MSQDKKISLIGHLEELRRRILRSLIAVGVGIAISFPLAPYVFNFLKSRAQGIDLIYTNVTGMLGSYMTVALYCGIIIALPFVIYELVMFLNPALKPKEKKYLYILLPSISIFFALGASFAYFILLPPALNFLLTFGGSIARPLITVGNYVSIIIRLLFSLGLVFEIPVVIFFLSKMGIVTPSWLAQKRKFALIAAFILGAAITPTIDPINQVLVAGPIIVLYELSIWLSKLARPKEGAPIPPEVSQ